MKKVRTKIHNVWFYLCKILDNADESRVTESRSLVIRNGEWGREITKVRKEFMGGNGYACCFDCCDNFTDIYMTIVSNFMLNSCLLW